MIRRAIPVMCLLVVGLGQTLFAAEPKPIRLWTGDVPLAKGAEQSEKNTNDVPTITVYPPPEGKNNGAAIVICPGGGYGGLAQHEGKPVADWCNANGMTGIVLRYRLGPKYQHPAMQYDVNRAIRMVRHNAKEWSVDPNRVGVLGFSAGGHEASTAATHYDAGKNDGDEIDKQSCRPDVAILIYPVITMTDPHTHKGSRKNLLGAEPSPELIEKMSNEKQVTKDTPPTFLVHSSDDKVVPIENSFLFAAALAKHGVPFSLVSFKTGAHGYGMGKEPETIAWPELCALWLRNLGFLGKQFPRLNTKVSRDVEVIAIGGPTAEPKKPAAPGLTAPTFAKRGWIEDETLRASAPKEKVIVSEKKFAALYKAWSLGEGEPPKIDFTKELVVVVTDKSQGSMMAMTDSKGDLKIHFGGPPSDKKGFGYVVQTVSREGVKTVDGKPLPKE